MSTLACIAVEKSWMFPKVMKQDSVPVKILHRKGMIVSLKKERRYVYVAPKWWPSVYTTLANYQQRGCRKSWQVLVVTGFHHWCHNLLGFVPVDLHTNKPDTLKVYVTVNCLQSLIGLGDLQHAHFFLCVGNFSARALCPCLDLVYGLFQFCLKW